MEKQAFRIEPFIDTRPDIGKDKILTHYLEIIDRVQVNAVAAHEMNRYGFDVMKLSEGIQACQAAKAALNTLTAALDAQQLIEPRLAKVFSYAGQTFLEYQAIARTLIKDGVLQQQYGLNGIVPGDLLQFMVVAHSGYKAAFSSQAYLMMLQQIGDVKCLLDVGRSALAELISVDATNEQAKQVAIEAIIDFDLAFNKTKDWMKVFRRAAKLAFKNQPALSQEIALG